MRTDAELTEQYNNAIEDESDVAKFVISVGNGIIIELLIDIRNLLIKLNDNTTKQQNNIKLGGS